MTDHTTLIAELRERAEWARAELNQAAAECFEKAAEALEARAADHKGLIAEARELLASDRIAQELPRTHAFIRRLADALEDAAGPKTPGLINATWKSPPGLELSVGSRVWDETRKQWMEVVAVYPPDTQNPRRHC